MTSKRIVIGQLWQETNTFNRNPTTWADFENWGIAEGDEIVQQFGETGELGGFLAGCKDAEYDIDVVGLSRFACWPWGSVDYDTWSRVRDSFSRRLEEVGTVDAVFLALHGAMAADDESDITGALLQLVRDAVGPDTPIVGTLDLHANITRKMIDKADLLVGYHACPHLDSFETGERAAGGLRRMLRDGDQPVTYWRKLPMITAAENHNTFTGLPAPLYRRLEQLEQHEQVLSAGLYMAMPWLDSPHLGWTVTLTTVGKNPRWQKAVDELAADCWELRHEMENVERFKPPVVVDKALAHGGHPIVIGDGADATNSGSGGDGTHLLEQFLKRDTIPHGAITFLVDPEAVVLAEQMGVGGTFQAMVGGAFSPEYSRPIQFRGTVERMLDVNFILDGHIGRNMAIHMGRGAVVRSGDVSVLFVSNSGPGSSPRLYETAGLDPKTCGIVVAKSPAGFRADYDPFVAGTFLADCPGCASPNWKRRNFIHVNRPLWPLDALDHPNEAKWLKAGEPR